LPKRSPMTILISSAYMSAALLFEELFAAGCAHNVKSLANE